MGLSRILGVPSMTNSPFPAHTTAVRGRMAVPALPRNSSVGSDTCYVNRTGWRYVSTTAVRNEQNVYSLVRCGIAEKHAMLHILNMRIREKGGG